MKERLKFARGVKMLNLCNRFPRGQAVLPTDSRNGGPLQSQSDDFWPLIIPLPQNDLQREGPSTESNLREGGSPGFYAPIPTLLPQDSAI